MKIYYCWFGGAPLTAEIQSMIATWRTFFPKTEIIEINETNFDVNAYPYALSAYEAKKFAFVSDCARAHYLYHHGGIYFDTDIEVRKNFDALYDTFQINFDEATPNLLMAMEYFSFEITGVSTALIVSNRQHPLLGELLQYYKEHQFVNELEPETINEKLNILLKNETDFVYKDVEQRLAYQKATVTLVPSKYLMQDKQEAFAVHHLDGSWQNDLSFGRKMRRILGVTIKKIIGRERFERLWKK